jgi:RHS repeat-associated protein
MTTKPPAADQSCNPSATGTTVTHSYDAADRITDAGYAYDSFGRITSVPAADAGGTALTAGYYTTDMVRSLTQGATTRTWTLDPNRRLRTRTDSGGATGTRTNHYACECDSPSWVAEDSTGSHWSRNIAGVDGDLAAIQDSAAGTTLQLANLHGDVVATASLDPAATGPLATFEASEFGIPRATPGPRYGWLGSKQRETDSLTGVMLMGVRLYMPTIGRFLQVDPVKGCSTNPYGYANQDPLNTVDLTGQWPWNRQAKIINCTFWCVARWCGPKVWGCNVWWWPYWAKLSCMVFRCGRHVWDCYNWCRTRY